MNIQWFIEAPCGLIVQVVNHGAAGMAIPCGLVTDPYIQASALKIVLGWLGV